MVTCERELGRWTVRINGSFIADFSIWRELAARRLAMNLERAMKS